MNKSFLKRAVFGAVFSTTLVVGVLFYKEAFYFVFLLLLALGLKEYYQIAKLAGAKVDLWKGLLAGISLFTAGYIYSFWENPYYFFVFFIVAFGILVLEIFSNSKQIITDLGTLFFGLVYVAVPLTITQYLFYREYNPYLVLSIFLVIWMNDSGAYIIGSLFGKNKLAPRISPKKTWEGALGGLLFSLILISLLPKSFLSFGYTERIVFGLVIVIFGTLGDLFQSALKRNVNIKDSGTILPGHGGILDRIDSMLFAIPAVFVYLGLIGYKTF